MTSPSRRPTRISGAVALVAASTAVVVGTTAAFVSLLVAAAGMLAFAAGLVRGARGWLAVGAMGLFAGTVLAGLAAGATVPVLAGAAATIVAWDLGEHALGLGEQIGREAATARQELVHAGSGVFVGAVAVGVAFGAGRLPVGSLPLPAFLAGFLASIVLVAALRS